MNEALQSIEQVFKEESGRVMASLIATFGDFDLAEDAMQEAFTVALERWPLEGTPPKPGAWITTTARTKPLTVCGGKQPWPINRLPCNGWPNLTSLKKMKPRSA